MYHVFSVKLENLDNTKYTWNSRLPEYQCTVGYIQKNVLLYLFMPSQNDEKTCLAKIGTHLDQNVGSAWCLILLHKGLIHYISQNAMAAWVLVA